MKSDLNNQTRLPVILGFAAFVILMAGVIFAKSVINPLLMALFVSIIFAQPILWLEKKKVPHGLAIILMILVILVFYFGLFELFASSLSLFIEDAPNYEQNFKEMSKTAREFLAKNGLGGAVIGGSNITDPTKIIQYTAQIVGEFKELLSREVTFIFLTIFLLTELEAVYLKMKVLGKSSPTTFTYLDTIGKNIRHYLSIKTLTSLATGILVGGSLAIIGVDYPILWGLIAFLLNFIPTIGSIIAAIPAVLFSIVQLGFPATWWTILVYVFANVVIGSILEPKIMGKGMGLSTFVVFLSLIFWGLILGIVGMFLSVPITMSIKIALESFPKTKWIAVMLGTKEDAEAALGD